jgi:CRP/FNR family transcriptional regulator, cyclic AMP receptor protein
MEDLGDQIEVVEFERGDNLFRENENSFHFYIIQEGNVEVYKRGDNGAKVPLAVVGPGCSIGEFAMIDRLPRSATADALSHVVAVKVSEAAYEKLLKDLPDWAVAVMKALVERLRQTNELIRASGITDENLKKKIETVEYDSEAGIVIDDSPFLGSMEEDDDFTKP